MNNLTSKTLYKVAEKSLKDSGVATVGDLCKLTELQASMLKGTHIVSMQKSFNVYNKEVAGAVCAPLLISYNL